VRGVLIKFARYFVTGGVAAIVDAGGFALLHNFGGLATPPAAVVSYAVATIVNFQLTARFVFAQKASGRGYLVFLSAALVGMMVNVGVTVCTERLFGLPPVVDKIIGIATAFSINFMLNLMVVFRPTTQPREFFESPRLGRVFLLNAHKLSRILRCRTIKLREKP
jgi:putative flippase GtrA